MKPRQVHNRGKFSPPRSRQALFYQRAVAKGKCPACGGKADGDRRLCGACRQRRREQHVKRWAKRVGIAA